MAHQKPPTKDEFVDGRWVAYECAAYLRGRGLVYGCGPNTPLPQEAKDRGIYSILVDPRRHNDVDAIDDRVDVFAERSFDWVFVGWEVKDFTQIKELSKKLKVGGHLIIHTPYPIDYLQHLQGKWKVKPTQVRHEQGLVVAKLIKPNGTHTEEHPLPPTRPQACIARYGAVGDAIVLTPLIRKLYEDGYDVTMNITPYCEAVFKNNPFVKNIVYQERNVIPNPDLGLYWDYWRPRYDKYINLSESIEGSLLQVEWRGKFYSSQHDRRQIAGDVNYYDKTLLLGGYPFENGKVGELYVSPEETQEARRFLLSQGVDPWKEVMILWGLHGSSFHKTYPLTELAVEEFLARHPEVPIKVVLVGQDNIKDAQFDHPQVVKLVGKTSIRQMLTLVQMAKIVVGPESALANAAACYPHIQKIVFMSHSTPHNLTLYWENCQSLIPQCKCHPCFQLHHSMDSCPLVNCTDPDTKEIISTIPVCTVTIPVQEVVNALDKALGGVIANPTPR
jgi:ADP-heptose:LPS heptosyltransferase